MTDARWIDAREDLADVRSHLRYGAQIFDNGGLTVEGYDGYVRRMALMHAFQVAYTSFEAALTKVLGILGEALPVGADWHTTLLRRACNPGPGRPAIFDQELGDDLRELLAFRHVVMHVYQDFDAERADAERARPAAEAAKRAEPKLQSQFDAFQHLIDPPEGG